MTYVDWSGREQEDLELDNMRADRRQMARPAVDVLQDAPARRQLLYAVVRATDAADAWRLGHAAVAGFLLARDGKDADALAVRHVEAAEDQPYPAKVRWHVVVDAFWR